MYPFYVISIIDWDSSMSTDTISSVEGFDEFTLSPTHPLYLHSLNSSGSRLVFLPFDGTDFVV